MSLDTRNPVFQGIFHIEFSLGEIRSRYFWWSIKNQQTGGLLEVVDKDSSWKGQMVRKACGNGNIRKRLSFGPLVTRSNSRWSKRFALHGPSAKKMAKM